MNYVTLHPVTVGLLVACGLFAAPVSQLLLLGLDVNGRVTVPASVGVNGTRLSAAAL